MNTYEHEPVPGLPAPLPEGETMLWQGSPDWKVLARRAFHVVPVGIYFVILAVLGVIGRSPAEGALAAAQVLAGGAVALAILGVLAWLIARSTIYTITSRRIVMRFGVALQICLNLPYARIDAAALRLNPDGSGDIPLRLHQGDRLAYLLLWPHARPWRFSPSEPMLRAVPNAEAVAQILGRALAQATQQPAPIVAPAPAAAVAGAAIAA